LHTNSCAQTMNRIIDVFPTAQQAQVRAQLALVLEGVLSQTLIPKVGGGRVMSLEIMVATPAIRNLIREEKIHQVYSAIATGQKFGMQTMNQSLADLTKRHLITKEDALNRSTLVEELLQLLAHEGPAGTLAAWVRTGARLLRPGGTLTLIWRADGLADVVHALEAAFGAVTVLPVHSKAGEPAIRILVRATKASRAPLALLPGLVLNDDTGVPTAEAETVLRGGAVLPLGET